MRRNVYITMFEGIFALVFIWMFTGCATQPRPSTPRLPPAPATEAESDLAIPSKTEVLKKPMPSEQRPEFYVHKVRWTGETISVIAQWYTGTQNNWKHIAKVNPDFDPKRMEIGEKILIPVSLLKKTEPMPRKFLRTPVRKKDTSSLPRVRPSNKTGKEEAAGAKETQRQAARLDDIELFQPTDTGESSVELDDIELFQPQDSGQTIVDSGEVELFQPVE